MMIEQTDEEIKAEIMEVLLSEHGCLDTAEKEFSVLVEKSGGDCCWDLMWIRFCLAELLKHIGIDVWPPHWPSEEKK